VRFAGTELVAAYDWDSLVGQSEAVLAGFAAGAHTEGSTTGTVAPSPGEVAGFLADYVAVRPLSVAECSVAVAAAAWVLAYNARCGVGFPARDGSPLAMLDEHRDAYLAVCW
jgi:hypothetical protein